MNKLVCSLSLFLTLMLSLQTVSATQDQFEYRLEPDGMQCVIAMQHYKNAPYPSSEIPFVQSVFIPSTGEFKSVEKTVFTPARGMLEIEGKTHATRFFGGWFFIEFNQENIDSVPSILNALMNFKKNTWLPLFPIIARASCQLRDACEIQNLQNPYAGRSLLADYSTQGGIPLNQIFIPTATPFESGAIRLLRSLTAVYGGKLTNNHPDHLEFNHGDYSLFSYGDTTISAYSRKAFLKGNFRETDDGQTANQFLKITSFETWFEAPQS
jgi:hypothetical protein